MRFYKDTHEILDKGSDFFILGIIIGCLKLLFSIFQFLCGIIAYIFFFVCCCWCCGSDANTATEIRCYRYLVHTGVIEFIKSLAIIITLGLYAQIKKCFCERPLDAITNGNENAADVENPPAYILQK
jgi:hypothetical protein